MTARRFAILTLVAGALAGTNATAQVGGITRGDSQTVPRRSSPGRGETAPELDSRTGQGELARDVTTRGADAGDDLHERTSFTGLVTSVGRGSITIRMAPPRVPSATEQVFRVADEAAVVVNGETSPLESIHEGDTVRIITAAADPEVAVRVFAAVAGRATPAPHRSDAAGQAGRETRRIPSRPAPAPNLRVADEDEDPNFDVYPENHQGTRPDQPTPQAGGPDQDRMAQMAMTAGEEAVLPLGIEVYGGERGALVTEMLADGPAAAAGVLINDLIVAVNRQTVADPELMEQMILVDGSGAAELTVIRNGETLQIPVQAGRLTEGSLVTPAAMQQSPVGTGFVGGGPVAPFTFGGTLTDFRTGGVLIDGTQEALVGGLIPGDVITGINGQSIRNQAQLNRMLGSLSPNAGDLGLAVQRNGQVVDLSIPLTALGPGFTTGFGAGVGTGRGAGTVAAPINPDGGAPETLPRSPGRAGAAQGGPRAGRPDVRLGGTGTGRSQAAPRHDRFGAGQNDAATQSGTGTTNRAGAGANGAGAAGTGVPGTGAAFNPGVGTAGGAATRGAAAGSVGTLGGASAAGAAATGGTGAAGTASGGAGGT